MTDRTNQVSYFAGNYRTHRTEQETEDDPDLFTQPPVVQSQVTTCTPSHSF